MSNGIIGIPKKKIKFMVSTAYICLKKLNTWCSKASQSSIEESRP
jgi:hypothetical protein